jgi:TRAP-type C4-dicarboxylate transport system permease small subunit
MENPQEVTKQDAAAGVKSSPPAAAFARGLLKWVVVNFEEMVCAILLTILVCAIGTAVFSRYILNSPLPWPEELSRYSFVWLTFIGSSLATKRQGHIVVAFMEPLLPNRVRLWVTLAVHSAVIVFLIVFVAYGSYLVQKTWVAVSPALSIRMGYVYLSVPLGSALMAVHMVRQMLTVVRSLRTRRGE